MVTEKRGRQCRAIALYSAPMRRRGQLVCGVLASFFALLQLRLIRALFGDGYDLSVAASLGVPAAPGTAVLDLTATRHVISSQIDASQQQSVRQGDTVSVLMPDGRTTVPGTVTDVSRVATAPPSGGSQGQGAPPQATVTVAVALADESAAGTFDLAPVYVSITTASRHGVLAVPVTALLAQPDGSYAVAVRSGGGRRLVTVQPGLFDDAGVVEVAGSGLAEGEAVEVPAR